MTIRSNTICLAYEENRTVLFLLCELYVGRTFLLWERINSPLAAAAGRL